jgi:hypothetical protein
LKFLKRLFGGGCTHKFSWPRSGDDGRYYQRCSRCGAAYEYDWTLMRRTNHVLANHLLAAGFEQNAILSSASRGLPAVK